MEGGVQCENSFITCVFINIRKKNILPLGGACSQLMRLV